MFSRKKKRAVKIFVLIYAVFGAILIYLLFFNFGLELAGQINEHNNSVDLVVRNNSMHIIRDIAVGYENLDGDATEVGIIELLMPGETSTAEISEFTGSGTLVLTASAPYHQKAMQRIELDLRRELNVDFGISVADPVFVGYDFDVVVEVCNNEESETRAELSESHDTEFFGEEVQEIVLNVPAKSCSSWGLKFTPINAGNTQMYFNFNAQNNTVNLKKELRTERRLEVEE